MARIEKWDEVHGTQAPDERMMAFLDSATDQYAILQLRRSKDTVYERFSSMRELEPVSYTHLVRTVTTIPYIIRTLRKLTVDRSTTRKSA